MRTALCSGSACFERSSSEVMAAGAPSSLSGSASFDLLLFLACVLDFNFHYLQLREKTLSDKTLLLSLLF